MSLLSFESHKGVAYILVRLLVKIERIITSIVNVPYLNNIICIYSFSFCFSSKVKDSLMHAVPTSYGAHRSVIRALPPTVDYKIGSEYIIK